MEKAQNNQKDDVKELIGLYCGGFFVVLYLTLKYGFSVKSAYAASLAVFIICLSAYPLLFRGTENRWTKDKHQWSFSTWLIFFVIPVSVLGFILSMLMDWLVYLLFRL